MSKIEVDKIDPQSGTDLELGTSGDTITIPAGVTFDSSAATNTLPSNVVTTDGTQTLTNKNIVASQLTGTITPSDSTVSTAKIVDANVTTAKIADANITLAKLSATGTQDATTFLRGDNTFASAGGANTPNFAVYQQSAPGTTLVQNTYTKVVWDSEYYDTNNAFASGRFTVPSGEAGKYFFTSTVSMQSVLAEIDIDLYLNGSSFWRGAAIYASNNSAQTVTGIIDLSVGNYVEVFVRQNQGTNQVEGGGSHSYFHGYKLI